MSTALTLAILVGFGLLTGGVAGLLGVGGGVLIVPFLVLVVGVPQHAANATSLLVILPTAVVATTMLRRRGIGDLRSALQLGTIGAIGSAGGALVALALPAPTLRKLFALLLALVGLRMIRDTLRRPRSVT
ncbi:MAG: sulfite exporter TauE/SafE family protein [Solirubrobacteraceae bacterium]|nr:sulfite exporter TauE/SafE family protein [Solirubrobacteraceae bacterium]